MGVRLRSDVERTVRFHRLCVGMVMLLLAQVLVGMAVNLYITIPKSHPGAKPTNYFTGSIRSISWAIPHGGVWLAVHVSLGVLLIFCGAWVTVLAARIGGRRRITATSVGLAAIVAAAFNGVSFLDFNQDSSSMIMAVLAVAAVFCYVIALD